MKKDINLLTAGKQGNGNKQLNNIIIYVVLVVVIFGILGFIFFRMNGQVKDLKSQITQLEQDKNSYGPMNDLQDKEFNELNATFNNYLADLLAEDLLKNRIDSISIISSEAIASLVEQGENNIFVSKISMNEMVSNKLTFTCRTKNNLSYVTCLEEMKGYKERVANNVVMVDNKGETLLAVSSTNIVGYEYDDTNKRLRFTITIEFIKVSPEVGL